MKEEIRSIQERITHLTEKVEELAGEKQSTEEQEDDYGRMSTADFIELLKEEHDLKEEEILVGRNDRYQGLKSSALTKVCRDVGVLENISKSDLFKALAETLGLDDSAFAREDGTHKSMRRSGFKQLCEKTGLTSED